MGEPFIPYGSQWIDDADIYAVSEVLRSGNLTTGPMVSLFEKKLAEYVGAKYCVVFSNATAALHGAMYSLKLPSGSSGITSPNTFVASANCMAYNNVVPTFADIDEQTYNISVDSLKAAIDDKTGVLIPVHFAGQACDMAAISALAISKRLFVIEDAAHAIGSRYADGSRVGNCRYSDMTVFSFHPVKTMTTGEGGAITTNDDKLFESIILFRNHGITRNPKQLPQPSPGPWYYEQQELGFNYRLTDIQCALGVSQLAKLEQFKSRRQEIVETYNAKLVGNSSVILPADSAGLDTCRHLYPLRIDFKKIGKDRRTVMDELADLGIGTQVHYIPVHLQPFYQKMYGYGRGDFPKAEKYYNEALSIPLFPKMTNHDVNRVVAAIKKVLRWS